MDLQMMCEVHNMMTDEKPVPRTSRAFKDLWLCDTMIQMGTNIRPQFRVSSGMFVPSYQTRHYNPPNEPPSLRHQIL